MSTPPPVLTWFKLYAALMAVLYVFCLFAGVLLLALPESAIDDPELDRAAQVIYGSVLTLMGFVLAAAFSYALFAPRQRWVWIFDIVLIAFGMTSCCCMPVAIPLLIYWVKPETKAYFEAT